MDIDDAIADELAVLGFTDLGPTPREQVILKIWYALPEEVRLRGLITDSGHRSSGCRPIPTAARNC